MRIHVMKVNGLVTSHGAFALSYTAASFERVPGNDCTVRPVAVGCGVFVTLDRGIDISLVTDAAPRHLVTL
jgi:hypothetical protein